MLVFGTLLASIGHPEYILLLAEYFLLIVIPNINVDINNEMNLLW